MAVDPRDFLLNTDYEMDKIVYFAEGELDNWDSTTMPHDLGFAPLVFGVFSFNSDFNDSRPIPYEEVTATESITFDTFSTNDGVYVSFIDQNNTHPKAYYRVYGFEPSDSTAVVPPTSGNARTFVLNTDYNYCKLMQKGTKSTNGNVTHDLGYIPQVLAWLEQRDQYDADRVYIVPIDTSAPTDPITNSPTYVSVDTSKITIYGYSAYPFFNKIHYRIYYDEG